MWVYGDRARRVAPFEVLEQVHALQGAAAAAACGIEQHGLNVRAFIAASGLLQGVADAEFEPRGYDDPSPAQDALTALVMEVATQVAGSWRGLGRLPSPLRGEGPRMWVVCRRVDSSTTDAASDNHPLSQPLPPLGGEGLRALPSEITIKQAEGYAFYGLYPEQYLEAGARLPGGAATRFIGLRSIGAGLAAMAAVGSGAPPPVTVRPTGDPFQRRLKIGRSLREGLLAEPEACYAIADEGPGLSGSSFASVVDWLEAEGVESGRITLLPSHDNPPGSEATPDWRVRWERARRIHIGFDELFLHGRPERHPARWFADLIGEPLATEPLPGGHRKLRVTTGMGRFLLKFAGLCDAGTIELEVARALHAGGFTAEPLGLRHGFLAERWVEGRALTAEYPDRDRLVDTLARYIGFRARRLPMPDEAGADGRTLTEMVRVNASEALADQAQAALVRAGPIRRCRTDSRMHAGEWLALPDGRLLKTDALDHAEAHDLIGCQAAEWDIAGAELEFNLTDDELERLIARTDLGRHLNRPLLEAYRIAYPAFQRGLWTYAGDAATAERYRRRLYTASPITPWLARSSSSA